MGLCGALASGALLAALRLRPEWRRRAGSLLQRRQWPDGASLPRLLRGFVGGAEAGGHEGLLAHVAWELEQEAELDTWQMLQVQAAIYSQPRASSEQTGVLQHCSIVQGKSLGDGWVQLKDQQGYAPQRAKGVEVLRMLRFEKRQEEGGSCEDVGLFSITSSGLCIAAGTAVGLQDWTMSLATHGCFAVSTAHPDSLQPLCSTAPPCGTHSSSRPSASTTPAAGAPGAATGEEHRPDEDLRRTATSTATATSTTLTDLPNASAEDLLPELPDVPVEYGNNVPVVTAFTHPSLFCFEVYRSDSYERELVIHQFRRNTSIHACDEHMIISDEVRDLPLADDGRRETTVGIGSLDCPRGAWGSWANAPIFLKAWQAVIEDGRYERHDWTVKVDADCVFRPAHLKLHLYQSQGQGRGNEMVFYKNFMDGYPVVGAIEVTSRAAVLALATDGAGCENMANGAAEDDWFARCLGSLGAVMREDGALLQHDNQPPGDRCFDGWWVAMHPYKDLASYTQCDEQAAQ